MTNEEICQAILAIEESDIETLFYNLKNPNQKNYRLCFNLENLQLYFCEPPNSEGCSNDEVLLCNLSKIEILNSNNKSITISKIKKNFGACNKSKL